MMKHMKTGMWGKKVMVEFDYQGSDPGYRTGNPDNRSEGEPAHIEITHIWAEVQPMDSRREPVWVDLYPYIYEEQRDHMEKELLDTYIETPQFYRDMAEELAA